MHMRAQGLAECISITSLNQCLKLGQVLEKTDQTAAAQTKHRSTSSPRAQETQEKQTEGQNEQWITGSDSDCLRYCNRKGLFENMVGGSGVCERVKQHQRMKLSFWKVFGWLVSHE